VHWLVHLKLAFDRLWSQKLLPRLHFSAHCRNCDIFWCSQHRLELNFVDVFFLCIILADFSFVHV